MPPRCAFLPPISLDPKTPPALNLNCRNHPPRKPYRIKHPFLDHYPNNAPLHPPKSPPLSPPHFVFRSSHSSIIRYWPDRKVCDPIPRRGEEILPHVLVGGFQKNDTAKGKEKQKGADEKKDGGKEVAQNGGKYFMK